MVNNEDKMTSKIMRPNLVLAIDQFLKKVLEILNLISKRSCL
jgi:hypothetical protein